MKIDMQLVVADLKAKALPLVERDAIIMIDTVIGSLAAQCVAQPGDAIASVMGLVLTGLKPAIDQALEKALPDAAKA